MKNQIIKNSLLVVFTTVFFWGTFSMYPSGYQDIVPLDPGVRKGKLPNGLTYYIKATGDGSSEMEIRLLIKAGAAVQDVDQYELQHVLEHVAFKAGKHMTMAKAHSLGFKLGDINGGTSFDFSQYYLKSINNIKERDIAFQLLQDIIWNLEFKDEYIDSERSVIINENTVRGGFGANALMVNLESSMIGRGAEQPKDVVTYINTFPNEALVRYYEDWYRPDLMAIVVVGDIQDVDSLEIKIMEKFSRKKWIKNPRSPIKDYREYRNLAPQFIRQTYPYVLEGSKNKAVYLRLYMRQTKDREEHGLEALQNNQRRQLLVDMLKDRFREKQQAYNSAFNVLPQFVLPSSLGLKLHITIEEGSEKKALLETLQVFRQLQVNGFNAEEFEAAKRNYIKSLSKKNKSNATYWVEEIRDHFIYGTVLPQNKKVLLRDMISNLTLTEFNQFMKGYIKSQPEDIIILAPPGHQTLSLSETTIRGWIKEVDSLPIQAYSKPKAPKEIMAPLTIQNLKESTVKENFSPIPGTTEYLLGNGVRLVLNPFDSTRIRNTTNQNKLSIHGFAPKGISSYPSSDYFSALNAAAIVINSGVGGLDKSELKRYFTDKAFNGQIIPYIDYGETGMRGSVSLEELETALQLVYLYFTAPNRDNLAFEDWKLQTTSSYVFKTINTDDFKTTIKSELGDYNFLPKGTKAIKGVSKTDLNRALEIYREIFGNAGAFTFVFTGDFPKEQVLSLCRKYLGNLPVRIRQKKPKTIMASELFTVPKPRSVSITATEYMKEVKVQLVYVSKLADNYDWKSQAKLMTLRRLMKFVIMQEIRFKSEEAGTYTIAVASNPKKSRLFNEIIIRFSCSSKDVDHLIMKVKQVVESFKKDFVGTKLLEEYVKSTELILEREKSSRNSISEKIYDYYSFGRPWRTVEQEQDYIKSLTQKDIKNTAQKLMRNKPFVFQMVPAKATK